MYAVHDRPFATANQSFYSQLITDIGSYQMTYGALLYMFLSVVVVALEVMADWALEDPGKNFDLLGGGRYTSNFTLKARIRYELKIFKETHISSNIMTSNRKRTTEIISYLNCKIKHKAVRIFFCQFIDQRSPGRMFNHFSKPSWGLEALNFHITVTKKT